MDPMETVETVATVELTRENDFPVVEKCCWLANLRWALNFWLTFETLLWVFFFIVALLREIVLVNENDLMKFLDEIDDWYFLLLFGERFQYLDLRIRTYIILINFLLMLIFFTYAIFAGILIYGINSRRLCCFIPFVVYDAIFLIVAIAAGFAGLVVSNFHIFRVAFLFLFIKVYVQVCIISLLKKYNENPKLKWAEHTETTASVASLPPQAEV